LAGHYVADILHCITGSWIYASDRKIKATNLNEVQSYSASTVYLAFYELVQESGNYRQICCNESIINILIFGTVDQPDPYQHTLSQAKLEILEKKKEDTEQASTDQQLPSAEPKKEDFGIKVTALEEKLRKLSSTLQPPAEINSKFLRPNKQDLIIFCPLNALQVGVIWVLFYSISD
jgi:hypothetical protein